MNPKIAEGLREQLESRISFQRHVIYGVLAFAAILALGLVWLVINQKVVITPNEIRRQYEIGGGHANKEYFADQANYVLTMILTTSPELVEHQNKVILKMAHPDGYGKLKADLDGAAIRVKRDRITTVWTPRTEAVFEREKAVVVGGSVATYIADTKTSDREKKYRVEFDLSASGRLYVSKVQEIVPNLPSRATGQSPG